MENFMFLMQLVGITVLVGVVVILVTGVAVTIIEHFSDHDPNGGWSDGYGR